MIKLITFEALSHPLCDGLWEVIEGGGLLADGQTWCSKDTWGSAAIE